MIKSVLISFYILFSCIAYSQSFDFFKKTDEFLTTYVFRGKVNYKEIKKSPELLDSLVDHIAKIDLTLYSPKHNIAFYINTYNLLVIKGIVNYYPVKSPMDIEGFFDKKTFNIGGTQLTLDQLEFKRIFADNPDPRYHFVLNCAAASCPTLYSMAVTPDLLENQLEFSTSMVMDRDDYVKVDYEDRKIYISKIFEWYKDMFTVKSSLEAFISANRFTRLPKKFEIVFMEYDWTLNEIE